MKKLFGFIFVLITVLSLPLSASTRSTPDLVLDENGNYFVIDENLFEDVGDTITFNTDGSTEPQKLRCATCGITKQTLVSTSKIYTDLFLSYHPQYQNWTRIRSNETIEVSRSRNGSFTYNLNIGGKYFSAGISYSKNSTNGVEKTAYASKGKYYRPALIGDKYYRKYKVEEFSPITGKLISTRYKEVGYTKDVSVEIRYKDVL